MNFPNILTLSRIILIPVFVAVFYLPFGWSAYACAVIFTIAALTDWLDGYLARRLNQTTAFGAFLDPVADKLMVAAALAVLIEQHHSLWLTVPAMIIIGREIVISALREWMAEMGKRASVAVSLVGKIKTTVQMVSIILLLGNAPGQGWGNLGLALLYLAAVLTLWSMFIYLKTAWDERSEFVGDR